MKKLINIVVSWVSLFGMFVPYGYLNWYWATPLSLACFVFFAGNVIKIMKETNDSIT